MVGYALLFHGLAAVLLGSLQETAVASDDATRRAVPLVVGGRDR